jgi:hemerythrin
VCRLGGDEFLVICPATPLDGALLIAEKLRLSVNAMTVPVGNSQWQGSISVGVAERTPAIGSVGELMKSADASVYLAKRGGRNRVATVQAPQ